MVMRITRHEGSGSWTRLRLEGRLVGALADLLERECAELLEDWEPVILDLAEVTFVDRSGVDALERLAYAGAVIFCPPGPVAGVLEGAGVPVRHDVGGASDSPAPNGGPTRANPEREGA